MDSQSPRNHHHRVKPVPSPRHSLSSSNSNSNSSSTSSNGLNHTQLLPPLTPTPTASAVASSPTSSYPPKPVTRSEAGNPYPTTFVQADTTSFKQVVQMLTGSTETAKLVSTAAAASPKPSSGHHHHHVPPVRKQTGFKLYERRNSLKNLHINPLLPVFSNVSCFSPRKQHDILSPSILDLPALVLSPVTPLIPDPFNRFRPAENGAVLDAEAEEKAIKEKGFFLHPSPASTPRDAGPPRLLPLFPTTAAASPGSSSS